MIKYYFRHTIFYGLLYRVQKLLFKNRTVEQEFYTRAPLVILIIKKM